MKVLEQKNFTTECDCCESKLEFTSEDIYVNRIFGGRFIKCPVCDTILYLDEIP